MLLDQHSSTNLYDVLPTDSVMEVLNKINESHSKQLAVVEKGIYYGLIEEDLLLDEVNQDLPIEQFKHLFKLIYLFNNQHIYDALQLMASYDISFIPILDVDHQYLGSLSKQSIFITLNKILGEEDAAIIVIELGARDNALSHIARIIEAEYSFIYSTAIHRIRDTTKYEMTIKLNKTNLSAVVSSLRRNDYLVKATFRDNIDQSDIQTRYKLLMNYLDL